MIDKEVLNTMAYFLSQICGGLVFVAVFLALQMSDMKRSLLWQIVCNVLGMLSYVLIGGISGCGIYLVAALQSLVLYLYRRSEMEAPHWLYPIIFAAYMGCSALTFRGTEDIVPGVAALLCAFALIQKNTLHYRLLLLLNGMTWIVYDLVLEAYGMLASHIFVVASAVLGLVRFHILKKDKGGDR